MFIGHYAIALAAKRAVPKVSLGILFAAAQLPDLVWPISVLLGWEHVAIVPGITAFNPLDFVSYPWSHSFLMVVAWGAAAGLGYFLWARDRAGAAMVALLVVSHWMLDWLTHRPDLPLWPGGVVRVGLGLWNSVAGTILIESAIFIGGVVIYLQCTRAKDRIGRYALPAMLAMLAAFYVADRFGTPPPSERALGWFALTGGLLAVAWAGWADRHRETRRRSPSAPVRTRTE